VSKSKLRRPTKNQPQNTLKSAPKAVSQANDRQAKTIDNTKYPPVLIVILHFKGLENTRNCLRSVFKMNYPNFNVLVIDNGTGNEDSKNLIKEFNKLFWTPLSDNEGFAGGCNAGISFGIQNDYKYIWLLNNDTTVENSTLSQLVEVSEQQSKVGAANAAILNTVTNEVEPGRGIIDFTSGKTKLKDSVNAEFIDCDWLAASNLLVSAEALKEVGAFDERYFLYFEDVELCHRLKLGGWKCLHVPKAHITHIGGASTEGELKHWRSYYYTRNRLLFFQTYANFSQRMAAFAAIWMHLIRHCVSLTMKGDEGSKQLQAEIAGAQDFIATRYGKWQNSEI
jgi:GT2 family glycosyltransferase